MLKDYEEIIQQLFQRKPKKRRKDLSLMQTLLSHYKNPQNTYPIIHIAGTNGKGQVSAKIASALEHAGYKVGLFISPHLFEYEERITVNGEKILKEQVIQYHKELNAFLNRVPLYPNFFECTAVYAFRYFHQQNVSVAVIETGLGGTYDATNVVQPVLSVITSIGLDHREYLGATLEEIAKQKAGIIKPKIPVVLGPKAKQAPIFQKAKECSSPIHVVEGTFPFYDEENQRIANSALVYLQQPFSIQQKDIQAGLEYHLPCRFEKKGNVIYDVAHNPDGFAHLARALEAYYPSQTFRFVIGISKRKDFRKCLEEIEKKTHFVHFVQADKEDAAGPSLLAKAFQQISSCPYQIEKNVFEGVKKARQTLKKKEMLVICGSFCIMLEAQQ